MQVILLEKVAQARQPGRRRQGQGRLRPQLPDPEKLRPPRHRSRDQGVRRPSRRTGKGGCRPSWPLRRPLGEKLAGKTVSHRAEGRRRRPPVRLGHQCRHRRGPDQGWVCEVPKSSGTHAAWPDQGTPANTRCPWRCTPTWWSRSPCSRGGRTPTEPFRSVTLRAGFAGPFPLGPTDSPQGCPWRPGSCPRLNIRSNAQPSFTVRPPRFSAPRDDDVARLRVPPHSIEAEQSVLGGLLLDNCAWDRAADLLTDSDFYRYEHKAIYKAIGDARVDASQAGRRDHGVRAAADARQGRGMRRPGLPQCLGAERAQCCQPASLCGDRARACGPAQAHRGQRRDRHQCVQSAGPLGQRRSSTKPRGGSSRSARKAQRSKQGFQSMDQLVVQLIDRVTELHENGAEDVTGVRTGFFDLDRMTAGLQPGDLIVLAARPSMGKTAFALNIAENVAVQEGLPVVVFSMEMGASQLALRHGGLAWPHRPERAAHRAHQGRRLGAVVRSGGQAQERGIFIDETPA
jgi:hypothetical protein